MMLLIVRRTGGSGALLGAALLLVVAPSIDAQGGKYAVKTAKADPPKELKESIAKSLQPQAIQLLDDGKLVAEIWVRKEVPANATKEQVKNGLTYRELRETTVLGAVRFHQAWSDYRKQQIKPGVYTLRLGFQPEDGDHAGTSPFKEFATLVAAKADPGLDPIDPKMLHALSAKSIETGHPAALMLFPSRKAGAEPQIARAKVEGSTVPHWVLNVRVPVAAAGQKATLSLGLGVVGHVAE